MVITKPPAEITPKLTLLGTSEYLLYLYQGETQSAVFEGGVGAMGPVLKSQIEELKIDPNRVKQLIVTHGHPDHVMAVPMMRQLFPEVSVLASKGTTATLSNPKALAFFGKIDQALTGSLLDSGSIGEEHRPEPMSETIISVDRDLSEGDTVQIDGAAFNVLETPGHSDCSLSFHEPDEGILFVADATGFYLPDMTYWWPMYFANYEQFIATIKRLSTLNADVLCLSHNAVIKGADEVKAYFEGALESAETYHRRIVDELKAGTSAPDLVEQLGKEVYAKTSLLPLEFFQKNCALLVKNSMAHEGINQGST